MDPITDLKYPVGKFTYPTSSTPADITTWVDQIAATPGHLRGALAGLTPEQEARCYRPGGWSIRQVVHHLADSHMNAYLRFKFALTENTPTIKPYPESVWAEMVDTRETPIATSVNLLEALHQRWVVLLRTMSPADWQREWAHPETGTRVLSANAALYAWHGRHHVGHIQQALRD